MELNEKSVKNEVLNSNAIDAVSHLNSLSVSTLFINIKNQDKSQNDKYKVIQYNKYKI